MTVRNFLFLILVFPLLTCQKNTPDNLIPEEKYLQIFTELIVLNQISDEQLNGLSMENLEEQIFEKYEVTQEEFRISHTHYQKDPEKQLERIRLIEESIQKQRKELQEKFNDDRERLLEESAAEPDTL